MAHRTKVQGTRYELEIDGSGDDWELSIIIGGAVEEKIDLKNNSLKTIKDAVNEILNKTNVKMNDFQIELMAKELYGEASGDKDLSEHKKSMEQIEQKRNMMEDPNFKDSLVSEFKNSFKIKEETPEINKDKKKQIREQQQSSAIETKKTPTESSSPQVKAVMSEINQQLGGGSPNVSTGTGSGKSTQQVDTRVSAVDVEDLIQELKDTKELLAGDIARVQQRMIKIDNIINKLSSISSKL